MLKTKLQRGFTLIELLVVISIIAILSSIVISSLSSARNKGTDAAAKSQMAQIRSAAELYYDNNAGSYHGVFASTSAAANGQSNNVPTMITQLATNVSGMATSTTNAGGYAIAVSLKSGGTWCIDHTGKSTSTLTSNLINSVSSISCN